MTTRCQSNLTMNISQTALSSFPLHHCQMTPAYLPSPACRWATPDQTLTQRGLVILCSSGTGEIQGLLRVDGSLFINTLFERLWEHLMESTEQLIIRWDKCTRSSLHEGSFSVKTKEHGKVVFMLTVVNVLSEKDTSLHTVLSFEMLKVRWNTTSAWLSQQETGLKVNQEASFAVQLNGARGAIDAKVHTPSGAVEECYITELDNGEHMGTYSRIEKDKGIIWSIINYMILCIFIIWLNIFYYRIVLLLI